MEVDRRSRLDLRVRACDQGFLLVRRQNLADPHLADHACPDARAVRPFRDILHHFPGNLRHGLPIHSGWVPSELIIPTTHHDLDARFLRNMPKPNRVSPDAHTRHLDDGPAPGRRVCLQFVGDRIRIGKHHRRGRVVQKEMLVGKRNAHLIRLDRPRNGHHLSLKGFLFSTHPAAPSAPFPPPDAA